MFEKVVPIIQATHPELLSFQLHLCFHVEKEDRPFEDMVVLKELYVKLSYLLSEGKLIRGVSRYLDFGPPNTQPHDESRKYRRFMRSIQGTGLCVIKNVVLNRYDCMPFEEVRG